MYLNSSHPNIKFNLVYSSTNINVLDVSITKKTEQNCQLTFLPRTPILINIYMLCLVIHLIIKNPLKRNKIKTVTLVLTHHPALKSVYEILRKAHRHTYKLPRLQYVLTAPPRVAFRNDKSKLKHPNKSSKK